MDALQTHNYRASSPVEIEDVQAAAGLLRDDMSDITGSRKTLQPAWCAAMASWMGQFVMDRAGILNMGRTSWRQREEFYVEHMPGMCLRT